MDYQNQIQDQIKKLQDKDLFEEDDSEFLVALGKILSRKFTHIKDQLTPPHILQARYSLNLFKKINSFYNELESLFELFKGSKHELRVLQDIQQITEPPPEHWLSKEGVKALNDTRTLFWKYALEMLSKYSEREVLEKNDEISLGVVVNFFDAIRGAVPIIGIPEGIFKDEKFKPWFKRLANSSFAAMGFVSPEEEKHAIFGFHNPIPHNGKMEEYLVFGYAFAFARPQALGGQENLSACFVIKYPWLSIKELETHSNTLQVHLNPILDGMRLIRDLVREHTDIIFVQKAMENIRNFYTYAMIHPNEVNSKEKKTTRVQYKG